MGQNLQTILKSDKKSKIVVNCAFLRSKTQIFWNIWKTCATVRSHLLKTLELLSRNYPQRHIKGHAMDNPYQCAFYCKEFISINHPKRHINMINEKFHITVLVISKNCCKKYSALLTSWEDIDAFKFFLETFLFFEISKIRSSL